MKSKLYFMLIIGMIFSSCENESDNAKPDFPLATPSQLTELDYEIYSLILNRGSSSFDLTIYQKTSTINKDNIDDLLEYTEFLGVENSTIESFYALNSKEYFLDNRIDYENGKISMISSNEYEYFFKGEDDNQNWKNFYKYFPSSYGLIKFSRIGFNNDFTQAIVNYRHLDKNGSGIYIIYYLSKTDGNWEIQWDNGIISN